MLFDIDEKKKYYTPPIGGFTFFNILKIVGLDACSVPVVPEAKQRHNESRRVWSQVSQALKAQVTETKHFTPCISCGV